MFPRKRFGIVSGCCLWLLASLAYATPKIAIIIDDLGNDHHAGMRAIHLPGPLSYAVLPHTFHSISLAQEVHNAGKEVLLHAPMQAIVPHSLGPGGLHTRMNKEEFLATLHNDLAAIPHASGINNHMGSYLTSRSLQMTWLMQDIKSLGLFFIDSVTSPHSIAERVAKTNGIPSAHRDVFLDDVRTYPAINMRFNELLAIARQKGYAIAIGHPYPMTLSFLERALPQLREQGYELVSASQLTTISRPQEFASIPEPIQSESPKSIAPKPTKITKLQKFRQIFCEKYSHICGWIYKEEQRWEDLEEL